MHILHWQHVPPSVLSRAFSRSVRRSLVSTSTLTPAAIATARKTKTQACASRKHSTQAFRPPNTPTAAAGANEEADKFRILFLGRDEFSCLVLQQLFEARDVWRDITIATQPDVHVGRRGSVLSVSPLKIMGEELNIPVYTIPKEKRDFRMWQLPPPFSSFSLASSPTSSPTSTPPSTPSPPPPPPPPTHILISASFGRILSNTMLASFLPTRRLNVHPSLLPSYRGPAPIQHTILRDEKETGVCVIEMLRKREGVDAGRVWGCRRMAVPHDANFAELRDTLATAGGQLLVSVLRDTLSGKATPHPQDPPGPDTPHAPFITAQDALVDFESMTAEEIYRRFRAIGHQKPLTTHMPDGKPLQLREFIPTSLIPPTPSSSLSSLSPSPSTPTSQPPQTQTQTHPPPHPIPLSPSPGTATFSKAHQMLLIRCARDTVLGVSRVKPEGKPDRLAGEFWRGLRGVKGGEREVVFG